jgi:tripartite ATP-independent transporter DctM subunit
MEWYYALLIILVPCIFFFAIGMPISFAFLAVMLSSSIALMGIKVGPYQTIHSLFDSIATFSLTPIPLFVLMGEIMTHSGLASQSVDVVSKLLGKVPARLSIVANLGGGLFGMLSGSTMASTAVLGGTLVPEMMKRGYSKALTLGPIMAAGGLAMIIPPSNIAVIYGTTNEVPVGKLLIAGFIPGWLMAFNYIAMIYITVKLRPHLAPPYEVENIGWRKKLHMFVVELMPLGIIVFLVTGIFILGIATPTEAAALGAMGTLGVTAAYRKMNWKVLRNSIAGTVTITGMSLLIIGGSQIFAQLLSYSGITQLIVNWVMNLSWPPLAILGGMIVIILIMGCFMESVPIIMVTAPIFTPIIRHLGLDPVWVGCILLIALEVGLLSPPFGLVLFVMKGVAGKYATMAEIYRAVWPYILCDIFTIILLILFPALALYLPSLMLK